MYARGRTLGRVVLSGAGISIAASLFVPVSAAAVRRGPHIEDTKYAISFFLPLTWTHAVVSTATSGETKLTVEDTKVAGTFGLVQVETIAGRAISAAAVAEGIRSVSGSSVLGSKVVKFSIGKVEQLTFTVQETGDPLVYGTLEGFYRGGRTYYVAFDSPYRSVANAARDVVMETWGK